ncbi:MAG: putative phosphotransferase [Ilumatobacteraceae bacterium]|nr:putative phosphotransferase [Ilumatobacteraceae bacterium]
MSDVDRSSALAAALSDVLGGAAIDGVQRLSGGASRETWKFVADGRPLILQRQRDGDGRDMGVEVAVLRAASVGGVAVPELIATSADESVGSGPEHRVGAAFMILGHVDGETIARKILRDDTYAVARQHLTADCATALARLHAIDPSSAPGLLAVDQVEQYRSVLDTLDQPHPTFELAFRWLDAHRPEPGPMRIVHGDFRLGNLMVGPDGLRAVLDWELAHIGDPLEDLGWLCVRAWRFGSAKPVAGVGEYAELIDAYRSASGATVDAEAVRWWEVLGTLKWGIMCIIQLQAHLSGASRSHELAAIGRRVCETEYDLFLALEDRW